MVDDFCSGLKYSRLMTSKKGFRETVAPEPHVCRQVKRDRAQHETGFFNMSVHNLSYCAEEDTGAVIGEIISVMVE
jgi:hypothetical protein